MSTFFQSVWKEIKDLWGNLIPPSNIISGEICRQIPDRHIKKCNKVIKSLSILIGKIFAKQMNKLCRKTCILSLWMKVGWYSLSQDIRTLRGSCLYSNGCFLSLVLPVLRRRHFGTFGHNWAMCPPSNKTTSCCEMNV